MGDRRHVHMAESVDQEAERRRCISAAREPGGDVPGGAGEAEGAPADAAVLSSEHEQQLMKDVESGKVDPDDPLDVDPDFGLAPDLFADAELVMEVGSVPSVVLGALMLVFVASTVVIVVTFGPFGILLLLAPLLFCLLDDKKVVYYSPRRNAVLIQHSRRMGGEDPVLVMPVCELGRAEVVEQRHEHTARHMHGASARVRTEYRVVLHDHQDNIADSFVLSQSKAYVLKDRLNNTIERGRTAQYRRNRLAMNERPAKAMTDAMAFRAIHSVPASRRGSLEGIEPLGEDLERALHRAFGRPPLQHVHHVPTVKKGLDATRLRSCASTSALREMELISELCDQPRCDADAAAPAPPMIPDMLLGQDGDGDDRGDDDVAVDPDMANVEGAPVSDDGAGVVPTIPALQRVKQQGSPLVTRSRSGSQSSHSSIASSPVLAGHAHRRSGSVSSTMSGGSAASFGDASPPLSALAEHLRIATPPAASASPALRRRRAVLQRGRDSASSSTLSTAESSPLTSPSIVSEAMRGAGGESSDLSPAVSVTRPAVSPEPLA